MNSRLDQLNQNQKLVQTLVKGTQKLKKIEKIDFLTGFICCRAEIIPDARSIGELKQTIHHLNNALQNQFISHYNFMQILVQSSNICKKLNHSLTNEKLKQKLSQSVENFIGQIVDNPGYIRQKWGRKEKPSSQNHKQESPQLDEQTKRLIKKIQQSDLKHQNARKKREKESQIRAIQLIQQEEIWKNQKLRQKIENSYVKIKCEICEEEIPFSEIGALSCGHIYHKACVRGHIEALLNQKKVDIPCPAGCGAYLPIIDIDEFIDGQLKQKYDKFSFDVFVERNQANTSWCPTAGCTAVFSHDGVLDNYRCPVCRKHYCLNCRCDYHTGMSCAEYRISNSYGENDKKFDEFVMGAKFKQCPKCKFWVERSAGCNSMSCRCGSSFCYDCGGTGCPHGSCRNSGKK